MNKRPTRLFRSFICLIFISFLLVISCNKDRDTFLDAVLNEEEVPVIEEDSSTLEENEDQSEDQIQDESDVEETDDVSEEEIELESRTTTFPAINDAYLQNGIGFDQELVRLQENFRRSYLMFDLSPIDSIGGSITSARLEFIINADDGNGIIKAFKGASSDWTEDKLSEKSAPQTITELGKIEQVYHVGVEIDIELKVTELFPEIFTLILEHEDGNDLAFASKENKTNKGPKLIVTYDAPTSSEVIIVDDNQELVGPDDDTTEDSPTEDDSTEDSPTEDDTTEDNPTEDDTTEDSPTEDDTTEDNPTEDDTTGDTPTGDDTTGDNPAEDDTTEDNPTEDDTTEDKPTEEDTPEEEINSAPKAVAEATPSSGIVPLEVNFSASKSTDDKGVASYEWDFKNGNTASSANPTHTFSEPGSYVVTLKVTDAEGLNSTDTVTITVNEKENETPVARANANVTSGTAPLQVNFNGSDSTDDEAVTKYTWNFKDGSSSSSANPSHTFNTPGTYVVELTVEDEKGLTDTDSVTITVSDPPNQAPVAVVSANITSGTAPLQVNFTGSNSTDNEAIERYEWNFKDGSISDLANPSHTFNTPGVYNVDLVVYDAQGLSDLAAVTITVEEEIVVSNSCSTISTPRSTEGFKQWCWTDLAGEVANTNALESFAGGNLYRSAHYQDSGTYVQGGRLHFNLIANASSLDYRQEIRTDAYTVLPSNTEEWIGYNIKFDSNYVPDNNPWVMTQFKIESSRGNTQPMLSLQPLPVNHGGLGNASGELCVVNSAVSQPNLDTAATGVVPVAGGSYDIVMHIVWGDASSGRFRLWVNGALVYDKQQRVLFGSEQEVGYWKVGVYQANWRNSTAVNNSRANGTTELHTSIGNLRQVMRKPTHGDYGKNAYNTVAPR
ncbi:PKD domain-containing protein [Maribacter algarum]|uniref:PKD domain-containing protein n=1 Tax=Maribacter algarum (ex Zhang et al. 2020) TaxID=2578118 RepID=A0A5S3PY46_9FLAO|nr:PKD domain-containing protein [Maribacter algarum]TMM58217.1 PKD domain-containing protein [Maribacter algarum]